MPFGGPLALDCTCCESGPPTPVACATCMTSWPSTLYLSTPHGMMTLTKTTTSWYGCMMATYGSVNVPLTCFLGCVPADPLFGTPDMINLSFRWPSDGSPKSARGCDPDHGTSYNCSNFEWSNYCPGDSFGSGSASLLANSVTCGRPINLTFTISTDPATITDGLLMPKDTVCTLTE